MVFMPDGIWGFVVALRWRAKTMRAPALRRSSSTRRGRPRHGARGHLSVQAFRRPQGGRRGRHRVQRGTVHALIGPNGSGKTTSLNVFSGCTCRPQARSCSTAGTSPQTAASARGPRSRAHLPEHPAVPFDDGAGKRQVGAERPGNTMVGKGDDALLERALSALKFVGIRGRADELISISRMATSAWSRSRARSRGIRSCCCWTSRRPA